MALHFDRDEFASRMERVQVEMASRKLDALLLFAQESMYWLTGYDTFGFCFFQCLVVQRDGSTALLTRSADLRQARHTSNIGDVHVWTDRKDASPQKQLRDLLYDLGLLGMRLGVEYDTQGLTAANGRNLDETLSDFAERFDSSDLIHRLRLVKSETELTYVRKAAELNDACLQAALDTAGPGVDEGRILAAMHEPIFAGGGDYPANEFIIGSAEDALLCRYKSGRRVLSERDQLTLEFAGSYRHYHVAGMRTLTIGEPTARHIDLHEAAREAIIACEAAMRPGKTFGDVFEAHATVFDDRGLHQHRLNACGYSLGARFTPCWMDWAMFYRGNPIEIVPNMVLFAHMILMDSESGTAMTLGRTYVTGDGAPEPLTRFGLDLHSR
ncbi:MAG: Xaa-Pro peptidase family protein [Pseudomonadota bacterium]